MKNTSKIMKIFYIVNFLLIISIVIYLTIEGLNYSKHYDNYNNSDSSTNQFTVFKFNKFNFTIPGDYSYNYNPNDKKELIIYGSKKEWSAFIKVLITTDIDIFDNYLMLQDELNDSGYDVRNPKIIEVENRRVIVMDYYKDEYNALLAYTIVNDKYIFEMTLYNQDNDRNLDYLNSVISIVNQVQFIG